MHEQSDSRSITDKLFCVTICGAQIGAQTWTNGLIQPLDRGDFDNRALLATLREIGYRGPVGIMCYGFRTLVRSLSQSKSVGGEAGKVPLAPPCTGGRRVPASAQRWLST